MKLTLPASQPSHLGWEGYPGHKGQDYGWGSGDRVVAAAPGTVVSTIDGGGYNNGWGNQVIIQHSDRAFTTYNHLATDTISCSVGDRVSRGQGIGQMGATGKADGKHLHFEVRIGSSSAASRVDPATYFTTDLPGTVPDSSPSTPASPEKADIMAFESIRHPNGTISFADEYGVEGVDAYRSSDIGAGEYLTAFGAGFPATREVSERDYDIIRAIADRRRAAIEQRLVNAVAARIGTPKIDTAAIAKAVSDAVTAQGVKVDASAIATAVNAALADNFAALPAQTAAKVGEKLTS